MKDDTILILGGVGIGAFLLYQSGIFGVTKGVSGVATTTTDAISSDIATFNAGLNKELKDINTTFGNITGTISELTTQLKKGAVSTPSAITDVISDVVKDVANVFSGGSSSPSSASTGSGGGTISQAVTGGYVVKTPQGGVSYATGTGPLSGGGSKNIFKALPINEQFKV